MLPLGEWKRFRDEILILAEKKELRTRLGQAAKRLAADYSIERYAQRYQAIYSECLAAATQQRSD